MKILLTGSTGFIGQYLTKALIAKGYNCRCLVRDIKKAKSIFKGFENNLELIIGDITDAKSLTGIVDSIDCVFHLAALMGHDSSSEDAFKKFHKVNVNGVENILRECEKNPQIKKIIHLSSTAAYGILKTHNINEETECNPFTPYQVTKLEGEQLALSYNSKGLPVTVLRPCMIYGPGFKGDFLTMTKVAKLGIYPKFGLGQNLAPSLFILDLIAALILSVDKSKAGEIYLIGPAESSSQADVLGIIKNFLKKRVFYLYCPVFLAKILVSIQEVLLGALKKKPIITKRNIASITFDRILDISKAQNELGFSPKISLDKGLTKTLQWYKKEGLI